MNSVSCQNLQLHSHKSVTSQSQRASMRTSKSVSLEASQESLRSSACSNLVFHKRHFGWAELLSNCLLSVTAHLLFIKDQILLEMQRLYSDAAP